MGLTLRLSTVIMCVNTYNGEHYLYGEHCVNIYLCGECYLCDELMQ